MLRAQVQTHTFFSERIDCPRRQERVLPTAGALDPGFWPRKREGDRVKETGNGEGAGETMEDGEEGG